MGWLAKAKKWFEIEDFYSAAEVPLPEEPVTVEVVLPEDIPPPEPPPPELPPQAQIMRYFVPEVDFFSPEMGSAYCKGLTYTIRHGNAKLAKAAEQWFLDGLVEFKEHRRSASVRGL